MKVKGWQIAVIVIGLLVGGGLLLRAILTSGDVDLPNTVYLVDVETGALYKYSMSTGRSLILPARRMDTLKIALVRIDKAPDGSWTMSERDLGSLRGLDAGIVPKAIDAETGKLLTPLGSPQTYTPPMPK